MFMQLFCLHVTSPRLHFWPSHFLCLGKGFHLLKTFLSPTERCGVVQSDFEFKKSSTFCCCQKCPNHFWKLKNNARIILHIFMYFYALCLILENPEPPLFHFLNRKGGTEGLFLFFSFPVAGPAQLILPPLSWDLAHVEGVSGRAPQPLISIERPSSVAFPACLGGPRRAPLTPASTRASRSSTCPGTSPL